MGADLDNVLVPNFGLSSAMSVDVDPRLMLVLLEVSSAASDVSKWRSSSSKAEADIFDGTARSFVIDILLMF